MRGGWCFEKNSLRHIETLLFLMFANTQLRPNVPRRRRLGAPCCVALPEVCVFTFITVIFPSLLLLLSRDGVARRPSVACYPAMCDDGRKGNENTDD